jgi:hypothetical protein
MPIKLNGSTSGFTQLQAAAVAASNTLTLPASNGTILSDDGSGNVTITGSAYLATTSGNVGIGSASPLQKLTVVNAAITGGGPASSGSAADPNATSRFQYSSVATDFGVYSAGQVWIQNRSAANYAINYDLVINPNGGNLQVGGTTVANTAGYVNSRTNTRAWVNFTGVTTSSVTASYNVSSVTRNATGDYTLNFTTALADANYIWIGYAERNTPNKQYNNDAFYENSKSTSVLNLKITVVGSLSTEDTPRAYVAIFGN